MSFNNVFRDLIALYPTWNKLQHYLESDEGGRFRIVDKKNNLCLIRYQKGYSRMDLSHSKWFRSVVWDIVKNRPLSVAPPKVSNLDMPFKSLYEINKNDVLCQEQLDGFMINCFKKVNDNVLYITSRSKLDAAGHFYSSKSFRTLFIEAYMKIVSTNIRDIENHIQVHGNDIELPNESKNEISVSYSFLVQHVEHRIVTPVYANKVFVVHKCIVYNDGTISINDYNPVCKDHQSIPFIPVEPSEVSLNSSSYSSSEQIFHDSDIVKWVKQLFKTKTWEFQGIVFKDTLGNRWRFRNDKYTIVKSLRGNTATTLDRFSQLYTQHLLYQYLQYYPDDNLCFSYHTIFMNMIIEYVYKFYVELFITKTCNKSDIDKMYIPHLYAIHNMYITQLRQDNKKITLHQITVYFHNQPWQRISFLIKKCQDEYTTQLEDIITTGQ